ncbi:MAG: type VI secretion system tip protein VgrG [Bacteroidota bacterium]
MTRIIPNESVHHVVTFDIFSEGTKVDPSLELMSINIKKEVNRIPTARMIIRDGDPAQETFEESNKDQFIPGKKIKIKIGRDSKNETLFEGIVTKHSLKIKGGGPVLIIDCKDESVKMTVGRHSNYFENLSDSQVIEELIGKYGNLKRGDIKSTRLVHPHIVQFHATDWDFLLSRADANGLLVTVDDGKVSAQLPNTSQAAALSLLYGATIFELEAEIDGRTQYQNIGARAWDYANQELFEAETDSAKIKEPGDLEGSKIAADTIQLSTLELQHSGKIIEEELQQWVDSCMQRSRLAKLRGTVTIKEGFGKIKPGDLIELQGIGDHFNGKAFVSGVYQEVYNGMWDTHIQFGLSPEYFAKNKNINDFPAAGLLPAIHGLQIGKVVQLENDPDGEDRILVKLPIIDPAANGLWARVACLDAGENRGSFFRPEIDDEVIVGFINDDPREAIVLGMLNSSAKPAPIVAKDVNHEKGFVTRDELKLLFDDEHKKITISTPGGNHIIIDESEKTIEIKDQNDNKLLMDPSGIQMDSPKEIIIKAGTSVTVEAATSLTLKGASISAEATGTFEAKGASTKMAAQGIAELSGSLIKIN